MSLQYISSDTYKFEHTCDLQETLMPTFYLVDWVGTCDIVMSATFKTIE